MTENWMLLPLIVVWVVEFPPWFTVMPPPRLVTVGGTQQPAGSDIVLFVMLTVLHVELAESEVFWTWLSLLFENVAPLTVRFCEPVLVPCTWIPSPAPALPCTLL